MTTDMTASQDDVNSLETQADASATEEPRNDAQLLDNMVDLVSDASSKLESMPTDMDKHCQILDKQAMQVQGLNVVKQGQTGE